MKKVVLSSIGILCLVFGGVGVFVPILPTTPFVILAASFFSASNERLNAWISRSKFFSEYINNYRHKTGISRGVKLRTLLFLWTALIISALIFRIVLVWIILLVVGASITLHILLLKNRPNKD